MSIKKIFLIIVFQLLYFPFAFANNDLTVNLTTNPPANAIVPMHNHPQERLVHVTLTVRDAQGTVVPNTFIKVHVHSPKKNPIFTTDCPWVEDTHLIEYTVAALKGIFEFDYTFPIRGTYRFDLQASRDLSSFSEKKSTMLKVTEKESIRSNLIILIGILFGIGTLAGFIIGRGAKAKQMAVGFGAFLFLVVAAGVSNTALADGVGAVCNMSNMNNTPAIQETASNAQMVLDFKMNPGEGRVGTLNEMKFSVKDKNGQLVPHTTYELKLWHMEADAPVFISQFFSPDGLANLKFQFSDGTEHEVRVLAHNALGTIELKKSFDVQRIHPPLLLRGKTEVYLLFVVLLGIIFGFKLQSRKMRNA